MEVCEVFWWKEGQGGRQQEKSDAGNVIEGEVERGRYFVDVCFL